MHKLVYMCDWLPPDFGAVGQYSLQFAHERAEAGEDTVLVGLSSSVESIEHKLVGQGRLTILRLRARLYDRANFAQRLVWTAKVNTQLIWKAAQYLRAADEILFTGSPPFLLHWLAPLNLLLRKKLVYRITDFHPECLAATMERVPLWLRLFLRLTLFWRRQVDEFEVLGEDQRARLLEIGIEGSRIRLKRDPSPVEIQAGTKRLPRPMGTEGKIVLLYSGNWGVAHDYETFVEAYRQHHLYGSGRVVLWLNAVGTKAAVVAKRLQDQGLPFVRSRPVPLDKLGALLVTPDAHLITLLDSFVGFVLPSKVYGCLASRKPVLYVGSKLSDVHLLCRNSLPREKYWRADVGDVGAVLNALEGLSSRTKDESAKIKPEHIAAL